VSTRIRRKERRGRVKGYGDENGNGETVPLNHGGPFSLHTGLGAAPPEFVSSARARKIHG